MDRELIERAIAKQNGVPFLPPAMPGEAPYVPAGAPADVALVAPEPLPAAAPPPAVVTAPPPAALEATPAPAALEATPAPAASSAPPEPTPPFPPDSPPPLALPDDGGGTGLGDAVSSLEAFSDVQAEAGLRAGKEEKRDAMRRGREAREWAAEARDMSERYDNRDAAADAMYRETMAQFRRLSEEAAALPPAHDRRGKGKRIFGALVGIIGGKDVTEMINLGVERDIAEQQAVIDSKRKSAADKLTELGITRQYIGDVRESTRFAAALRKERFAGELEAAAADLTSANARNKAVAGAAQIKVDAQKEKLDVLKKVMGGKMSALEAAMLVKLGVLTPAEAKLRLGGVDPSAAAAPGTDPAGLVPGKLTKTHASKLAVDTFQNEVPGVRWLVDPAKVSPADREEVQKRAAAGQLAVATLRKARGRYEVAMDKSKSDAVRLSALGSYRTLMKVTLPGFMSQATGSGTPQSAETDRLLESMPPVPVVNDVAGLRAAYESIKNWVGDRTIDPEVISIFAEDFTDLVNVGLRGFKGELDPSALMAAPPASATPSPASGAPRTPAPAGAKGPKTPAPAGNLNHLFK
jgi:hypothetical protein